VKNKSGDLKLLHLTKKVKDLLQITKLYNGCLIVLPTKAPRFEVLADLPYSQSQEHPRTFLRLA